MSSLYLRLLLVIVGVSLLAVTMVALISSRTTTDEFRRFVKADSGTGLERIRPDLLSHYEKQGNWIGVLPVLERLSNISGKQLILTDAGQSIVAVAPTALRESHIKFLADGNLELEQRQESGGQLLVQEFVIANPPRTELRNSAGEVVGNLYLVPARSDDGNEMNQNEKRFLSTVNRSLMLAGGTSAFLALGVAFFLARRILRPVQALTLAAKRMKDGDLTVRVQPRGDDELAELGRAFNSMAEVMTHTEELRRNLVSDVAHELRTPLTSVRCQLEAMQDGLAEPDQEAINSIHEEVMQLNRLVEDLQELAVADAAKFSLSLQAVSLKEQAEQVVRSLQPIASRRSVALEVTVPPDLPLALADPGRLRQILTNILQNAIMHTETGSMVRLSAKLDQSNSLDQSRLEVAIRDSGSGIDPEHLPHIFDRFFRTDESRSRATGGSGLGLAIVKQLVELHGGKVWAESRPGLGTTIRFTLPVSGKQIT
jgi:two-component system sensor histidine kinase BaeS